VPIDFPEAITESQAVVAQPTLDPKPLNSNPKPLEPLIPVLLLLDVKFEKEPVLQGPDHCDIINSSLYYRITARMRKEIEKLEAEGLAVHPRDHWVVTVTCKPMPLIPATIRSVLD